MQREKLVLVPGMMCDARLFAPQIAALSARHDVTVCVPAGERTIAALAGRVLDAAGAGPINLAGLSMGGIVAMAVAALSPERVRRLALLDTNHRADPPERRPIREAQSEKVRDGALRAVIIEEMKPNYLAAANRSDQALLDLLVTMALDLGAEAFVDQSIALRDRPDQSAALSGFAGPALVLCGAEDALCPPERHHEIAELLPDPRLVVVPGAGHISTLEEPLAVTEALADWLARPAAGPLAGDG